MTNVIIWARVSSREQKEGYSIDAQLRATRERAQLLGLTVVREFAIVESAKAGAERAEFDAMIAWVRAQAKKSNVQGIVAHKLDRTCRNMGDAVLLRNLETECGVRLYFCENHFGADPAGVFTYHVMASVSQYYSDNLRTEVLKGMHEKVRDGWPMGRASFGYRNVPDCACPIVPHPEQAATVVRIFDLFGKGDTTFQGLVATLAAEGRIYRPTMPRFHRTALSWILGNRIYMGEIEHDGKIFPSKVQPLVTREEFKRCQEILHGRNRRIGRPEIPFGGGFFRCGRCGAAMTGELVKKKLTDGSVREHLYYKCGNEHKPADHPSIRWRGDHLEERILVDLDAMRLPDPAQATWLRNAIDGAFAQTQQVEAEQRRLLSKQLSETANKLDRLLNGYLEGLIDQGTYQEKQTGLKQVEADLRDRLAKVSVQSGDLRQRALSLFDLSQKAGDLYRGSKSASRRDLLSVLTSNRTLDVGSLCLEKRQPFGYLAEGLSTSFGRGDRIRTCDLCVPNATL